MPERIETPPTLAGNEQAQLQQIWAYLYSLSQAINNNLEGIGSNELTDAERTSMQAIIGKTSAEQGLSEMDTLKSLIIKTANFVQNSLMEYRLNLIGDTVASGTFGRYVRHTGLDVAVTPTGITQNYTFEEVVQGLKEFSINAKNYIKTGLLRTVNNIPVYGVAIGKDVVTFSQDGTETYNDGNKVAELTADELSFWQNGVKIASYTGSKISFLFGGVEVFYIQSGKIYCSQDLEIASGKAVKINQWTFDQNGLTYTDGSNVFEVKNALYYATNARGGIYFGTTQNGGKTALLARKTDGSAYARLNVESTNTDVVNIYAEGTRFANLGTEDRPFVGSFLQDVIGRETTDQLTRSLSIVLSQNPDPNNVLSLYPMLEIYSNYSDGHVHMRTIGQWIIFDNTIDCDTVRYTTLTQKSSRDVKHGIRDMEDVGEKIDALRPVTFVYDDDEEERRRAGLIYEETMPVMPEICTGNEADKGISYMELVPMLLKEIQSLRARVSELERRMEYVQGD